MLNGFSQTVATNGARRKSNRREAASKALLFRMDPKEGREYYLVTEMFSAIAFSYCMQCATCGLQRPPQEDSTHLIVSSQYLQSNDDDVDSCMRSTLMCVLVFIFDLCICSPILIVKWFLPDRCDEWSTS